MTKSITEYIFKNPQMYSLRRDRDGAGDSGLRLEAWNREGDCIKNGIKVGYNVVVGTYGSRSYSNQDWWQTTIVTSINSVEGPDENNLTIKFSTGNSEYTLTSF